MDKKHGIITMPGRWLRLGKGQSVCQFINVTGSAPMDRKGLAGTFTKPSTACAIVTAFRPHALRGRPKRPSARFFRRFMRALMANRKARSSCGSLSRSIINLGRASTSDHGEMTNQGLSLFLSSLLVRCSAKSIQTLYWSFAKSCGGEMGHKNIKTTMIYTHATD